MILSAKNPRSAINKAYLKAKPARQGIDLFKKNLISLLDQIKEGESEEFHKSIIHSFLAETYYKPAHYINTKGRNDLVIHNGENSECTVGVIIEVKSPTNKSEMVRKDHLNNKAFHELLLYYLRERILLKNIEIKNLIITNVYEWFVFDANFFENNFGNDKKLIKKFQDFENGRLSGTKTDFFYKEIAEPAVKELLDRLDNKKLEFTYFSIKDFEKPLRNSDPKDDNKLIVLYKLLSPEHILKKPFSNDNNNLDRGFYHELLHIIGLNEVKDGSKRLIQRQAIEKRSSGSLIENIISHLISLDKISRLDNPKQYGTKKDEQLFNLALELSITWINRILFLKLLEAQLISYHKGDKSYAFLNVTKIKSYDDLNDLFFDVVARRVSERSDGLKKDYTFVPYLNSSLFEPTDLEHSCLFASQLSDNETLPILSSTVLKVESGKKRKGHLTALEYLLSFLDAYDFGAESKEEIQEENKTLINSAVLGLIFEKINGYKDGAFFTPGQITMYMAKEAIKATILQKFNSVKSWDCKNLDELFDKLASKEDKLEANEIINGITICDPAVGSGHFLVSALNEIIRIKSYLKVLFGRDNRTLRDYHVEVSNDELVVLNEEGEFFEYTPKNKESQRIQEALFHEKQRIIEKCLFGVDINSNSVKICRLRLWIELLKHSYYTEKSNYTELETLPNIDINIKCGNSLISRFPIDSDLKIALSKSKFKILDYRKAVESYQHAKDKEEKKEMENIISLIKRDFRTGIASTDPKLIKLNKTLYKLNQLGGTDELFELTEKEKKGRAKERKELEKEAISLQNYVDEIKNSIIYEHAFEWRFEFPEVLKEDGTFCGFDLIIGNPPYGVPIRGQERKYLIDNMGKVPDYEIYYWFIDLGNSLLKDKGKLSYIIPNSILFNVYASNYRLKLFDNWALDEILDCTNFNIFEDATVRNAIIHFTKTKKSNYLGYRKTKEISKFEDLVSEPLQSITKIAAEASNKNWGLIFSLSKDTIVLIEKIKKNSERVGDFFPEISQGLIAYDKYQGQSEDIIKNRVYHSNKKIDDSYKEWLYGEDITRYNVKWNGKEYINYCDGIANPRDQKFFTGNRLLIREITNPSIYAAYASEEYYNDPAIIIIKDNQKSSLDLYCLLGILNSKLASFYHFNSSPKATKGAFPKILVTDIKDFPIPINSDRILLEKLESLSKQATDLKNNGNSFSTDILDSEINQLVYKIYGLNNKEIEIIESAIKS